MKRGNTEVETCELNGWNVGTVLRGHEQWSDGRGVWTTIRITAMGESLILARSIRAERTDASGSITEVRDQRDREGIWTLAEREWTNNLDPARSAPATREGENDG